MTKARDLANIISGGFTVADLPTLTASEIPNLDASKITTGSIADARIPASAVSQHATSFDDNKIVNDISTLAIRQASNENKGAYNTNSMYVDVFQDDTGIGTETNTDRNANEYVSSIISGITTSSSFTIDNSNYSSHFTTNQMNYSRSDSGYRNIIGVSGNSSSDPLADIFSTSENFNENGGATYHTIWFDFGEGNSFDLSAFSIIHRSGQGSLAEVRFFGYNAPLSNSEFTTQSTSTLQDYELFAVLSGNPPLANAVTWSASGLNTNNDFYRYIGLSRRFTVNNNYGNWDALQLTGIKKYQSETVNATGSFESNVITASSSTNKMGAIITYQDNAGTNALNTDIVLQLSADGGSNYSTATMTAMPDFASGIKMAKVNDLSVTAGTQLKYKISFANQSASKEARIRGVSLQY